MRIRLLTLALLTVGLLVACTPEGLNQEMLETPAGSYNASLFEKGHVRVYVDPGTAAKIEQACAIDGLIATKAADILGHVHMERTFPFAGKFEKRTKEAGLDRWYDVWFDEETPLTKAAIALEDTPGILSVEYRPITHKMYDEAVSYVNVVPNASPSAVPAGFPFDDPSFEQQWHYYNDGSVNGTTAGCDINVVPVWKDYTTGSSEVIVCVVDGGIDCEHEDLKDNLWSDPGRPNVHGYNFYDNSINILKTQHGTHVAGTIAAVNNNGIGVCGIAGGDYEKGIPGVRLMSAQIFKEGVKGGGHGARAIKWGADHGAVISQNSWGYDEIDYVPQSDKAAIDYFNTYAGFDENNQQVGPMAGGLVVFAASNENIDFGSPAYYEGALAVGAVGADYYKAYYSCYGDWVDVAAPGGDVKKGFQVLSTLPDNKYGLMQGTSMACPHVSGVAALIVSKCGGIGFTRDMLWSRIVSTEKDISNYNRNYPVGGLVDATAAILAEGSTPPEAVNDFEAGLINADFIRFSLTVPADEDDNKAYGINIYYDTKPFTDTKLIPYKKFPTGELQAGEKMEGMLLGLEFETKYYLACEAYDRIGNRSSLSNMVTVMTGENHAPSIATDDDLTFTIKSHEKHRLSFVYSEPDGHGVHSKLEKGSPADTLLPMKDLTQIVEVNALLAEPGTYTSVLNVFDDYEKGTIVSYMYTILQNHAPVVLKGIDNMVFGSKGEVFEVDLEQVFNDPDGELLELATFSSDNDILNLHIRERKLFVTALKFGYGEGTVTATDARGQSVLTSFKTLARDGSDPVDIYPTCVSDGKLYIRTVESAQIQVQIFNEAGARVINTTQNATPFAPAVIDMTNFGGGPYSVKVSWNGNTETHNILKL